MRAVLGEAMQRAARAGGSPGVAAGQQQRRTDSVASGFGLDPLAEPGQQPLGLLEPPLADPQGGQPGERPGVQAGAGALGDPQAGASSCSASSHRPLAASTLP